MWARTLTTYKTIADVQWAPQVLCIAGATVALALPPFNFFLILPFCFWPLLQSLDQAQTNREAFTRGWAFGVGFFVAGLYWLANAFVVSGLWYLAPLGAFILPVLLAVFIGIAAWISWRYASTPFARALLFATSWAICEWLRGHILTGFPWNLLGYGCDIATLQITAYIGIYGLSALIILWAVLALQIKRPLIMAFSWILLFGLYATGLSRLNSYPTDETNINIRLVQPCIHQAQKWDKDHFEETILKQVVLSQLRAERPLNIVIWAEASVPAFVQRFPALKQALAEAVPPGGILIFGAPREEIKDEKIYSSMMAMNEKGDIIAHYDKAHLVPFGEYFPFRQWFKSISKLTHGDVDYAPGNGITTISLPNLPSFSPLICYEVIFPGEVALKESRPQWLLNLTNDGWYGATTGPHQHLQISRVRSIEEGIPLIRVANNGISAVIDPVGRIISVLDLNALGILDTALPKPIENVPLYAKYKDLFFWIIVLSSFVLVLTVNRRKEKQR